MTMVAKGSEHDEAADRVDSGSDLPIGPGLLAKGVLFPPLLYPSVLIILKEEPVHGYVLLKKLIDIGLVDSGMDPSVIYRLLRGLEEAGMAQSEHVDEGKGPTRKVYRLTDRGNAGLSAWPTQLEKARELIDWFMDKYSALEGK
jgi:PadR family transcriptional regulator